MKSTVRYSHDKITTLFLTIKNNNIVSWGFGVLGANRLAPIKQSDMTAQLLYKINSNQSCPRIKCSPIMAPAKVFSIKRNSIKETKTSRSQTKLDSR